MQLLNTQPAAYNPGLAIHSAAAQHTTPYLRPVPADPAPGNDPAVRQHLAAHPALGTLPEQDRHSLLRWSRIRTLKRREVICRQGDPAASVILVLDGYLKKSVALADGGEVFLDIAGPGECTGEFVALDRSAHDADITALSPCRLLMIDAGQFWQAFEHRPEALLAILRLGREQQQRITAQLVGLGGLAAPARLANALLRLAQLPPACADAAEIPLRLSQAELAVMTGATREMVNKQLGEWRAAGWVRMCGGTVISIDAAALAEVAGEDLDRDTRTVRAGVPAARGSAILPVRRSSC